MKMPDVTNSYQSKMGLGSDQRGLLISNTFSYCLFCLRSTLGPHSTKISWEPKKHTRGSHFTNFTFAWWYCFCHTVAG